MPGLMTPTRALNIACLAVLLGASLLVATPTAQADPYANIVEGWETYTTGTVPDNSHLGYTASAPGSPLVSVADAHTGTKSLFMGPADGLAMTYDPAQELCTTHTPVSFWMKMSGLPSAGGWYSFAANKASSPVYPWFGRINNAGVLRVGSQEGFTTNVATLSTGVWIDITWVMSTCAAGGCTTSVSSVVAAFSTTVAPGGTCDTSYVKITFDNSGTGTGWFLDDINAYFEPATPPTSEVAVNDLRGFDVSDDGAAAIARLDDGDKVQVFGGQTLAAGASNVDADCTGTVDGVTAYTSPTDIYLSYFTCNADGEADSLRIRSGTLGDPTIPPACDFADADINNFLTVDIPNDLREIASLSSFPIDFSGCNDNNNAVNNVVVSWSYSSLTTGRIGVFAVNIINNGQDGDGNAELTFNAAGAQDIAQFCSWTDTGGVDHLGAVSLEAGTKFYLPTVAEGSSIESDPVVGLTLQSSLGGTYALSKALSCAQNRGIIINAAETSVSVICTVATKCPAGVALGGDLWTPVDPVGFLNSRSATISGDGLWAAYLDDNGYHILNATNGNETDVLIATVQGGEVFVDMRMDRSGSSLWVAYTDHIYRYDISDATCGGNCTNIEFRGSPGDIDGDGIPNELDPDMDNDGLHNDVDPDIDDDGVANELDASPRGGGIGAAPAAGSGAAAGLGVPPYLQTGVDGVVAATGLPVMFAAMIFGLFGLVFTVAVFAVPTFFAVAKAAPRHAGLITVIVGTLAGSIGMVVYYAFGLLPGFVVSIYVILLIVIGVIGSLVLMRS
ncbi:MAG: hypothetical protein WC876_04530 [Candidatus Thermoplasmatota archaeon]